MTQNIKLPHFNLPHFRRQRRVPTAIKQGTVLVLTPLGKQKADSFSMDGPKADVLSTMAEIGPSTMADISNETGQSDDNTKRIIKALVRSGYVRVASIEE